MKITIGHFDMKKDDKSGLLLVVYIESNFCFSPTRSSTLLRRCFRSSCQSRWSFLFVRQVRRQNTIITGLDMTLFLI